MAEAAREIDLDALCETHRLSVVKRLPVPDGGSRFLVHVVDETGEHLLLKRGSGLRGRGEIPVLEAWKDTGRTARKLHAIDAETFTCEWIDGVTLDRSDRPVRDLLRQAGEILRELHKTKPPAGLMSIRQRASPEWVARDMSRLLPGTMLASAEAAAKDLCEYEPLGAVLLHGDFVPGNILVAGDRMVAIDSIGFVGPASWDIAQVSVAVKGRDRRENLASVLEGYGSIPRNIESAFAYFAFMFLAKNLEIEESAPGTRGQFVEELDVLANSLG